MIGKLLEILEKANLILQPEDEGLGPEDVADALWLALRMDEPRREASRSATPTPPPIDRVHTNDAPPDHEEARRVPTEVPTQTVSTGGSGPSGDLLPRTAGTDCGEPASEMRGVPFRTPSATSLPGSLRIGRAFRPLMRRVPSRTRTVLDAVATAEQIAEHRLVTQRFQSLQRGMAWSPILRPKRSRWFEIALVADASRSMVLWHRTICELFQLLERHGAFRDAAPGAW